MRHTRLRRRAFFAFLGVVWIIGALITIAWFRISGSAALPDSPAPVVGLDETVSIDLDGFGIPAISATTEHDAWSALGFMHASDRLWQMEFFRRIGSGRLSELFGRRHCDLRKDLGQRVSGRLVHPHWRASRQSGTGPRAQVSGSMGSASSHRRCHNACRPSFSVQFSRYS